MGITVKTAATTAAAVVLTASAGLGLAPTASAHSDFERISADLACGRYVQWGRVAAEPVFRPGQTVCVWPQFRDHRGKTIAPVSPVLDHRLPPGSWRVDWWSLSDRMIPRPHHHPHHPHHHRGHPWR